MALFPEPKRTRKASDASRACQAATTVSAGFLDGTQLSEMAKNPETGGTIVATTRCTLANAIKRTHGKEPPAMTNVSV
jgi:hypothetical protein